MTISSGGGSGVDQINSNEHTLILIINADRDLQSYISKALTRRSYQVVSASTGREALYVLHRSKPDLVLLDSLPDTDGLKICQEIRQFSDVPILFLTAVATERSIIRALDCGANNYLIKPISTRLLLAHVRAILKRVPHATLAKKMVTYADGDLVIDVAARQVYVSGKQVCLTATEFRLLAYLLQNKGRTVTTEGILEEVWGREYCGSTEYVHTYIGYLRRKLEKNPKQPRYLLTEHGVGYKFASPCETLQQCSLNTYVI